MARFLFLQFCSLFAELLSLLKALKSISKPLKNIKKINPKVDNILSIASRSTKFKNECPMTMPIKISATTIGKNVILSRLTNIGVKMPLTLRQQAIKIPYNPLS